MHTKSGREVVTSAFYIPVNLPIMKVGITHVKIQDFKSKVGTYFSVAA